jgi:hypothetical protein
MSGNVVVCVIPVAVSASIKVQGLPPTYRVYGLREKSRGQCCARATIRTGHRVQPDKPAAGRIFVPLSSTAFWFPQDAIVAIGSCRESIPADGFDYSTAAIGGATLWAGRRALREGRRGGEVRSVASPMADALTPMMALPCPPIPNLPARRNPEHLPGHRSGKCGVRASGGRSGGLRRPRPYRFPVCLSSA